MLIYPTRPKLNINHFHFNINIIITVLLLLIFYPNHYNCQNISVTIITIRYILYGVILLLSFITYLGTGNALFGIDSLNISRGF